jgi:ectoine hydroxylase-related dioxygenase (phytanoyl-CoA dioxygenase family)
MLVKRLLNRSFSSLANYALSETAKRSFFEKGYAVLPNFLSEAELAPLEKDYDKFMRGEIMSCEKHKKDFCDMSQSFDAIQNKHPNDWQIINAMLPRVYLPSLQNNIYERRAAHVAKLLFPNVEGGMILDYDQLLNKRPGKEGAVFAWHQDMAYWPKTPDTRTVTFSLAVDPTTKENGALKFWTGSGLARTLHPHKPVGSSRDDAHAVAVQVDEKNSPIELCCVKRGDVTIHDEWVVHGSGGNLSKGTRRTYVVAFRTKDTVDRERRAGFTHSHNDSVNWDTFNAFQEDSSGGKAKAV